MEDEVVVSDVVVSVPVVDVSLVSSVDSDRSVEAELASDELEAELDDAAPEADPLGGEPPGGGPPGGGPPGGGPPGGGPPAPPA